MNYLLTWKDEGIGYSKSKILETFWKVKEAMSQLLILGYEEFNLVVNKA